MLARSCLPYVDTRLRALADGRGALLSRASVEERRWRDAERDVEALAAKLSQAHGDLCAAEGELQSLTAREGEAERALEAAAAAVQCPTRQQLEEVRCLLLPPAALQRQQRVPLHRARSLVVRRALSLVHALLHPEEIPEDGPALVSDWERLGLLLRESLLQRVGSFPPSAHPLVTHPHVMQLIAAHVEGGPPGPGGPTGLPAPRDQLWELRPHGAGRPRARPPPPPGAPRRPRSGPAAARAEAAAAARAAAPGAAAAARRPGSAGGAAPPGRRGHGGRGARAPRLSEKEVDLACRPVGALFRWLVQQVWLAQALLLHGESAEREGRQLRDAEAAAQRCRRLRGLAARLRREAAEAEARRGAAEGALGRLRSELAATEEEERQLREQRAGGVFASSSR